MSLVYSDLGRFRYSPKLRRMEERTPDGWVPLAPVPKGWHPKKAKPAPAAPKRGSSMALPYWIDPPVRPLQ